MKYTFKIKEVKIIDLNGTDYREAFLNETKRSFDETIGNLIYAQTGDIDLSDKARDIHASRDIILTHREKPMFEKLIEDSTYLPLIKRAILSEIKKIDE